MGSFLLVVVAAIVLSGIVFGAAAFTLGRDRGLSPSRPDGVPFDLPADRPLERADVEDLRIDTAVRGYRMNQVDEILRRVSDDFDFLHARIIDLEDQLYGDRPDSGDDEERPFEFPWDAESTEGATEEPGEGATVHDATTTDATRPTDATGTLDADAGAAAAPRSTVAEGAAEAAPAPPSGAEDPAPTGPPREGAEPGTTPAAAPAADAVGVVRVDPPAGEPAEAEVAGPRSGRGR